MYFNVAFLDEKLYQSLSFDADIKFPEDSLYSKKIWVLKEYKKEGGELHLSESEEKEKPLKPNISYSFEKTFNGDELIVELVKNFRFTDDFDYFTQAEIEEKTGDEELDAILATIKDSDFNQTIIKGFILGVDPDEESECEPDCQCECE
tara:strand:+ start:219 stop:665 length:447 start_codon:yes stop_codon:yes gene_type:complete